MATARRPGRLLLLCLLLTCCGAAHAAAGNGHAADEPQFAGTASGDLATDPVAIGTARFATEGGEAPAATVSDPAAGVVGSTTRKFTLNDIYTDLDALLDVDFATRPVRLPNAHLGQILRLALVRNRAIAAAAEQVHAADGQVIQARAALGARLAGSFRHTTVDETAKNVMLGRTIQAPRDSQQAYLELTQPIFLSGKDRSALASARIGRSIASASQVLTTQSILLKTTLTWLGWLFAGEAERVGMKDLELAKAHHALVTARFKQKQASQFEVLRAEVRLAQATSDLRKKTNARDLARLDLLAMLDLPEDTQLTTGDRLAMVDLDADPARDASEAMNLREDLRMKRLDVRLAREAVAMARSENQPVVSLFGQSGVQDPSSKSTSGTFERKGYWNAGIVANFTLADGGNRKGKLKEAQARLALAENALQETANQAAIEIRKAWLDIETARQVVAAQREALKQAEEALRLAGVRYHNGLFTQVELFDAENAYLLNRLQYLQAIFSFHQAFATYRLATGQLGRELIARASGPRR